MRTDSALTTIPSPRQDVRPVGGRPDQGGPGQRFGTADAMPARRGPGARPAPEAKLGDANAAQDLARLAQRYANAARSAARNQR